MMGGPYFPEMDPPFALSLSKCLRGGFDKLSPNGVWFCKLGPA